MQGEAKCLVSKNQPSYVKSEELCDNFKSCEGEKILSQVSHQTKIISTTVIKVSGMKHLSFCLTGFYLKGLRQCPFLSVRVKAIMPACLWRKLSLNKSNFQAIKTIKKFLPLPPINRRSTDLHTRIAKLGVVLHHCEFFFSIFQKTFLEKKIVSPFYSLNFFYFISEKR